MSGDRSPDALVWLGFAIGDLEAARSQPGRHVRPRIVTFHSQQAAEKAIKAALVHVSDDRRSGRPATRTEISCADVVITCTT